MKRIDRETVQKILDTADIVEVVSDFVHLKRRGANYIGLCPFHNERTPSFSVSKSKGICKCFSCGKGGSPVNFLMELEQLSFNEALRYLARKYNIEIQEHEMSEQEREEQSARESMLAVNDFAMHHFEQTMTDTDDGRDIGQAYFRQRGINDAMISRFHLGYALEKRDDLYRTAIAKGFNEKYLIDTGLCYKTDRGDVRDRFYGRVIYPVFTVSGKVVAFGGRTLRTDKEVAKYVNSPESLIYRKSHELYGLYQAKQAIVRKDKCILVEGYMDVISMHQSGIENVVASSGTSLTEGQIRLIHRFTDNVTVIYDSDPAGIKASLRGIDLLLAEGLNIKVLLLPEGDDPDSFSQSHTSSEVEEYIAAHEEDFISFKTRILLDGLQNDPVARSKAIQNIVMSISMIPDQITRTVYIAQCSRMMEISEKVLTLQVAKYMAERADREAADKQRRENRERAGLPADPADDGTPADRIDTLSPSQPDITIPASSARAAFLRPYEEELLRYIFRYGLVTVCEYMDTDGNLVPMSVLDYVGQELAVDDIQLTHPAYVDSLNRARETAAEAEPAFAAEADAIEARRRKRIADGIAELRNTLDDLSIIERKERELTANADNLAKDEMINFRANYLRTLMMSDPDDAIRHLATELSTSRHQLSKIYTKHTRIPTELDRLSELVPEAVYNLKCAHVEFELRTITTSIAELYRNRPEATDEIRALMKQATELNEIKKELAKYLGERILSPRIRK